MTKTKHKRSNLPVSISSHLIAFHDFESAVLLLNGEEINKMPTTGNTCFELGVVIQRGLVFVNPEELRNYSIKQYL